MIFQDRDFSKQLLLPVLIIAFTLATLLFAQAFILMSDRTVLSDAVAKQTAALAETERSKNQANNLIKGVMALAKENNKDAQNIINELKKAGVNFQDSPPPTPQQAPTAEPAKK